MTKGSTTGRKGTALVNQKPSTIGDSPPRPTDYGLPTVMNVRDVATFLGVDVKGVYAAVNEGSLPGKRIGKRIVILRDSFLAWLESSERR